MPSSYGDAFVCDQRLATAATATVLKVVAPAAA
jgi:hypothetical protein